MTHNEIIRGCRQGREESYRALVNLFAGQLMGTCVRYLRDKQKAEDALQETYIQVFRSIHRYDDQGNLGAWLNRIAVNCCLKVIRKQKNHRWTTDDLDTVTQTSMPDIEARLDTEDILRLLDHLPDHYRVVFNLRVIEGYSHSEIADMLGIEESLSRTKVTRAKKMMQDILPIQLKKTIV